MYYVLDCVFKNWMMLPGQHRAVPRTTAFSLLLL